MALEEYDLKKIGLFASIALILMGGVIGGASGFYYYTKYRDTEKRFREVSVTGEADVQALVAKVGKLIKLPEGELPTVATVSDLARLSDQPFFARAKVGDKVLLYTQAKKAFLYDPVNNVIVEVGPLVIPSPSPGIAGATSDGSVAGLDTMVSPSPAQLKVAVFNGTSITGLQDKFAVELTAKSSGVSVSQKATARKKDYAKSVIIDLTGNNQTQTESIAKELDLTVSALPSDEKAPPNSDLLIILGADKITQ